MTIQHKNFAFTGGVFLAIAIILGAFGSHAFKDMLSPEKLENFEIGVRYQIYHGLGLLWLSLVVLPGKASKQIFFLWVLGISLFSGSLYILAFREIWEFEPGALVFITPLGGTLLIIGWLRLLLGVYKMAPSKS